MQSTLQGKLFILNLSSPKSFPRISFNEKENLLKLARHLLESRRLNSPQIKIIFSSTSEYQNEKASGAIIR